MEEVRELFVKPASASERLDVFLRKETDLSRTKLKRLIEQGFVLADGKPQKDYYRVSAGERITLLIPHPEPLDIQPEPIPLAVLHEDEDILVIDKPAGLVIHPVPGHPSGTLLDALRHYFAKRGIKGQPGIVHRLDKETSGAIVVAKTEDANVLLHRQFKLRQVKKVY